MGKSIGKNISKNLSSKYSQELLDNAKQSTITDSPPIRIYLSKIENLIIFRTITGYYFKLLSPEIMKSLGSTNSTITKNKNGENVPHLEISDLVLVHCKIVNKDCQQDSRVFIYLFLINPLVNY